MSTDMGSPWYNSLAVSEKQSAIAKLTDVKAVAVALQQSLTVTLLDYPNAHQQNALDIRNSLMAMENGAPFSSPTWVCRDYGDFSGYTPTQTNTSPDWERASGGGGKILGGILLFLGGIAAVGITVASFGTAAPLAAAYFGTAGTIGVYAIAGTTVTAGAYAATTGVSDSIEGGQDVVYGLSGNRNAVSVNPLRDTAFKGHEDWYYNSQMGAAVISTAGGMYFTQFYVPPQKPVVDVSTNTAKSPSVNAPYLNSRPSYRSGLVEAVWEANADPKTGMVQDPTGKWFSWDKSQPRFGQWDMGHIPGQKYYNVHQMYLNGQITKDEFLRWFNDPTNYRPELVWTNRSGLFEEGKLK
jgi:hypothetical protein